MTPLSMTTPKIDVEAISIGNVMLSGVEASKLNILKGLKILNG
ncbi:hypothetical protein ACQWU4_05005 [Chryseobacterium sp. MIQD13]